SKSSTRGCSRISTTPSSETRPRDASRLRAPGGHRARRGDGRRPCGPARKAACEAAPDGREAFTTGRAVRGRRNADLRGLVVLVPDGRLRPALGQKEKTFLNTQ